MDYLTILLLILCVTNSLAIWWLLEAVSYLLDRDDERGEHE